MTQILVIVDNATGTLVTPGPIWTGSGLTVTRTLDKAGAFSFSVPWTDERALALVQPERYVKILKDRETGLAPLLDGIIKKDDSAEVSGGSTTQITGLDLLEELKHPDTGRGLIYQDKSLLYVVNDLISRASGWTAVVEVGVQDKGINARYDGVDILKALQILATENGLHLRLGEGDRVLEFGAFGQNNGLRVMKTDGVTRELRANDKVLLVDKLTVGRSSFELINWIEPLGAGEGEAALTLQHSTRGIANGDPLDIQTTFRNGQQVWYLALPDSIAEHGLRSRTKQYDNIIPLYNTEFDITNAANALYDACVADLLRSAVVQSTYGLTVKNAKVNLLPGDKIHVRYKGKIYRKNMPVLYVDINDDFWITEVTERHGQTDSVDLKISNLDRREVSAEGIIVDAISRVEARGLRPTIDTAPKPYVYTREIAPGFPTKVPLIITPNTLYLNKILIWVFPSPFRATSSVAKAGGRHRHRMFKNIETYLWTPNPLVGEYRTTYYAVDQDNTNVVASMFGAGSNDDLYTYDDSGDHTHDLDYGIQDDTRTPLGISVLLDDIDRTSELGGPFNPAGGTDLIFLDPGLITNYLLNDPQGLRRQHTLELRCAGGQGRMEVVVEIYSTSQSIPVTGA